MHSTSKYLLLVVDTGIFALAAALAWLWRVEVGPALDFRAFLPYILVSASVGIIVFRIFRLHLHFFRFFSLYDLGHVLITVTLAVLLTVAVSFSIFRLDNVPRSLPIIHWLFTIIGFLLLRMVGMLFGLHMENRAVQPEGAKRIAALIIGYTPAAEVFLRSLPVFAQGEVFVTGILDENPRHLDQRLRQCQVIGHPAELKLVLANMAIHGVTVRKIILAVQRERLGADTRRVLAQLEQDGRIELYDYCQHNAQFFDMPADEALEAPQISDAVPLPAEIEAQAVQAIARYGWLKRAMDIFLALVLGVFAVLLSLLIVPLIRLSMGAPVLFWQERPGRGGKVFRLYKFRTLGSGVDSRGNILSDEQRQTKVGTFLRRTRLDELPQVYNLLIGDMSFVGPRPLLPIDLPPTMPDWSRLRAMVRPGMTGWAQINGGQAVSMQDKVILDAWYITHMSLWLDLFIIFKTFQVVLKGEKLDTGNIDATYSDLGLNPAAMGVEQSRPN